jgi:small-conductance mechanosensitive channel
MGELLHGSEALLHALAVVAASLALGALFHTLLLALGRRLAPGEEAAPARVALRLLAAPTRLLLPLLALELALPLARLPAAMAVVVGRSVGVAFIAAAAWIAMRATAVLAELLESRYRMDVADNLTARKVHTQIDLLRRIVVAIVAVVSFGGMLMVFDRVRQLGTSLLASAGIAGIIVGFAAQRSLANLLAGLQLAIAQPFRIDDVVIVEGEWGRIEEITLTYVVVKIWDERRLVVPLGYFIEKPFQNWTRVSAELLGTAFLYVDYTVPVQAVRDELRRVLEGNELWDRRAWGLQVTNTTERVVELRALMSARDASQAWNLRCDVREKLVDFLQRTYPDALPRLRGELERDGGREREAHAPPTGEAPD